MHFVNEFGPNFKIGTKELRHDNEDHRTGRKQEENFSHRPSDQDSRGGCWRRVAAFTILVIKDQLEVR